METSKLTPGFTVERSVGIVVDGPAAAAPQGLADRSDLVTIAVERTRMPMVITDVRQPDNPIVLANKAFLDLTGYRAEEVIGRNCRFLQGPETSPAAVRGIRTAVVDGAPLSIELLNYRKDGSTFWNQLLLSPIRNNDGKLLYYFASQKDVTRRRKVKELEEAERRLLREVDHRAMNALALVQAIVSLSRADNVENYSTSVRGRVQALARAHALLAANGWSAAPLSSLIVGEAPATAAEQVNVEGPDVAVRPQLVQPLILFLHELMANAAAHGALSKPEGRVRVSWQEPQADAKIRMRWEETGGPRPAEMRKPGFGSTVTKALVERQLGGELQLDWAKDGLIATIGFSNHHV